MADESCVAEVGAAVRALKAVEALLTNPTSDPTDPVIAALATLEAARTAQVHAGNVVMHLTERALRHGASFSSLGFRFDDPYE
jgi:hypothetical protein